MLTTTTQLWDTHSEQCCEDYAILEGPQRVGLCDGAKNTPHRQVVVCPAALEIVIPAPTRGPSLPVTWVPSDTFTVPVGVVLRATCWLPEYLGTLHRAFTSTQTHI